MIFREDAISGERETARWLALTWRLPTGPSTPRVTVWRSLRRLGAAMLTPGAAILPLRVELREQLDWLAQEIEELGGDAWVLPVSELSEVGERKVRNQMQCDRQAEYVELGAAAQAFLRRAPDHPGPDHDYGLRLRTEKELVALQRRFRKIRARDYFDAPGRREAATVIDRCVAFRQGISSKLSLVTDEHPRLEEAKASTSSRGSGSMSGRRARNHNGHSAPSAAASSSSSGLLP